MKAGDTIKASAVSKPESRIEGMVEACIESGAYGFVFIIDGIRRASMNWKLESVTPCDF